MDTVGDPKKYEALLSSHFPQLDITVAKKADSLYPVVSAASICAKVTRDRELEELEISRDLPSGSGYPGDPKTKAWLRQHIDAVFGFPSAVRFSWSTARTLLHQNASPVYWYVI